jgi:protein-tyrosine kinase
MENIRQAIERAKGRPNQQSGIGFEPPRQQARRGFGDTHESKERVQEVELDFAYLQSQRIVAYDGKDLRSRSFDMLRTEILRSMDLNGWKTLAVTSPTPNCGKTLTAINLALSMARQPERQVLLADLDLRKAQVAVSLGLKCQEGVLGVIEGRIEVDSAIVRARVGASSLEVLPTKPTPNSSDLVGSNAMRMLLQDVTGQGQPRIVILDLPPLLTGHDVISILPQVDCVLLVAAVGTSRVSEIEECNKYLQGTDVVRFVLNKVPESTTRYAYYWGMLRNSTRGGPRLFEGQHGEARARSAVIALEAAPEALLVAVAKQSTP